MDLKQLQYFLELAEQEHVSSVADLLNISQPALSKSIANLEKEIGVKLFDRYKNHIKLNETGRKFAEYAQKSLLILQNGLLEAKQTRYEYQGIISIMCYTFSDIIAGCALEYQKLNPYVKLVIKQGPAAKGDDPFSSKADFLLYADNRKDQFLSQESTWISQPLFEEEQLFFISPKYREYPSAVDLLSAQDLKDDLFVTMPDTDLFFTDLTYPICQMSGFLPRVYFQTNDFLMKVRIVGEGQAIAIMPECCSPIVKKLFPDIRTFRIENFDTKRTICLMHRKEPLMSEAAQDCLNFIADYFSLQLHFRNE